MQKSVRTETVIIGGGNAGFQVADSLYKSGYDSGITILCQEPHLPYQRPPLSKTFLEGSFAKERLFLRKQPYYDDRKIILKSGVSVTEIDYKEKQILCDDGSALTFDTLVFATGARVRKLASEHDLMYLRTIDDVEHIREKMDGITSVALIGGGFIGLEMAATLRKLGKDVSVIEGRDRVLPDLVAPMVSEYLSDCFKQKGVRIFTGCGVNRVTKTSHGYALSLSDDTVIEAEAVIVGIGVIPNIELAEAIGIQCDNGILVDQFGRTNLPDVYAAGDCARGHNLWLGEARRIESVQNAVDQAMVVASAITGEEKAYEAVPWFWSDQFDIKLQMAGISQGYDDCTLRGCMENGKFSVCYFKADRLIAVDSINSIADHMAARKLLTQGIQVTREQCADVDIPLKSHLSK